MGGRRIRKDFRIEVDGGRERENSGLEWVGEG